MADVLRSGPFFFASFGVYAATLWVFDKPEKEHNGLYATVLARLLGVPLVRVDLPQQRDVSSHSVWG